MEYFSNALNEARLSVVRTGIMVDEIVSNAVDAQQRAEAIVHGYTLYLRPPIAQYYNWLSDGLLQDDSLVGKIRRNAVSGGMFGILINIVFNITDPITITGVIVGSAVAANIAAVCVRSSPCAQR